MNPVLFRRVPVLIGGLLLVAVVAFPVGALLVRVAREGYTVPSAGAASVFDLPPVVSASLLVRTVALAGAATLLSLVWAVPGAAAVARCSGRSGRGRWALLAAPLLLPPMIYAFGWRRMWGLGDELRCVWVWSSWVWPIPALLLGTAWGRCGPHLLEQARLEAGVPRAFLRVVVPPLLPTAAGSGLLVLALLLGDHSVPHACNLQLYATGLLSVAESSSRAGDALFAAAPLVGLIALLLLGAVVFGRWAVQERECVASEAGTPGLLWGFVVPATLLVATVGIPLAGLLLQAGTPQAEWGERWSALGTALGQALAAYQRELGQSLALAAGAGLVAVIMGAGLVGGRRGRGFWLVIAALWATLPAALLGEAVVSAYRHIPAVYDHWSLVIIGYAARFGWVGLLVGWLARGLVDAEAVQAARLDGADQHALAWHFVIRPNCVLLASGVLVVAALSLAEVVVAALVRVPSVGIISLILIEKFHRFEDDLLVALSLWLLLAALPGLVLTGLALRRE